MAGKKSILIIDDEQDNLDYLQAELQDKLEVSLANGGSAGIAQFGEKRFNLVLTDVRMAGLDGIHVLKTVKQLAPECQVLLMSGYSDLDIVIDAMNEGAFAFVTKPMIREVLLSRIEQAIAFIQAQENQAHVMRELRNELLVQSQFAQRLSALAAMSGGIAHELQQPLSGIGMYSATVKKMLEQHKEIDQEFLKETMDKIENQVQRASTVIEHMREFSSGGEGSPAEPLKVRKAVERALDLFNLQLRELGIELTVDVPARLEIHAEQNRFEQVIINLVSNAKDSIEEAGGAAGGERRIHIRGCKENGKVLVDISDTGAGIPEGMGAAIFEPFVTNKKGSGGSGLGLFICRRVLQDYAATIEVLGTGAGGTTFRLCFPER